ncbi:hypothetical protein BDZ94DRAFT_1231526 [Collybia nuda]|uniref:Uncharacterized protein n=1 Tax=Collybia nuda TaxID=64659 RepID=A0A9P6CKV4_9AGAR|nr:hypothetical protein BDZ94DRAFT_1231526 [Collybia nuda]
MPQQTDTAIPTRLSSVNQSLVGKKLRLAGRNGVPNRLLSYDVTTGLILIAGEDKAILVDVSLCVDPWSSAWIREPWATIMTIGYVESSLGQLPIPIIPAYASAPSIDPKLVFRALLVVESADLDLDLWNSSIKERERLSAGLG